MSSILKVDQLQDSVGNSIISSNGSGTFTPGSLNIANAQIASNAAIATSKLGTGAVLQVVYNSYSTEVASTSDTIVSTGLEATITPSSTSSKIFVTASQAISKNNDANAYGDYYIFRGSTELIRQYRNATFTFSANYNYITASYTYLDSPNTTSATTYSTRLRRVGGSGQVEANTDDSVSSIVLMEIAG